MSDKKDSILQTANDSKANANNVSENGAKGLVPPPYHVKPYENDHDENDPMDLLGNHIMPNEILVPGDATSSEKFMYYQSILESIGETMNLKPGSSHLLGLRGIVKDDEGNILQTSSAAKYQMALHGIGKLEDQHHFSDSDSARQSSGRQHDTKNSEGTWNDMLILLTIDEDGNKKITESVGSLDPSKTGSEHGTAHLMDGTFEYGFGKHQSDISAHVSEIEKLAKNKSFMDKFDQWKSGKKEAYNALVPKGKIKVLRDSISEKKGLDYKDQPEANGFFTDENIEDFNRNKKKHPNRYFSGSGIAINGHMGGDDASFSEGCWNLKRADFVNLMLQLKYQQEISGKSEKKFRTKFTVLDVSKVGFKLINSEEKGNELAERIDYGEILDYFENANLL